METTRSHRTSKSQSQKNGNSLLENYVHQNTEQIKKRVADEIKVTIEKDFENKSVILVDDVLNSGKTLIYAVKLFLNKPVKQLNTLILVDRSHTRFPVKADFVGLSLSTTLQERIDTDFSKKGKEAVYLV